MGKNSQTGASMPEMLTTRQLQTLLKVDRTTIYRMAEDGRLPAIKVGKQWRFSSRQIEAWMASSEKGAEVVAQEGSSAAAVALKDTLPVECVQMIQDTFADLLGVMIFLADMEGNPITAVSNAPALFQLIHQQPGGLELCLASWKGMAESLTIEPRFSAGVLGLLCARSLVRVGAEIKGMVILGAIAPPIWPPDKSEVLSLAQKIEIDPGALQSRLDDVHHLTGTEEHKVLVSAQRIADIISHIVSERRFLHDRLQMIAELTNV
jgi:excisionase family DNA binding protein